MTIEEARSLMLTLDELREIYEQVQRTGEPQRLYLLEGDEKNGIAVDITSKCVLGYNGCGIIAAENYIYDIDTARFLNESNGIYPTTGTPWYAHAGNAYHGLHVLGWACFRSKADAEAWEAATLGHCKEEAV